MKELKHINQYFLKYKYHLLGGVIFVTIANLFSIIPAQIVRTTINMVVDTVDLYHLFQGSTIQPQVYSLFSKTVVFYGLFIVFMALLRGVFMFLMRQTIIVMSRLIEYDLKNELYAHYQSLPLSFYRQNNTGDLMARISEDVGKVRMYVGPGVMYSINLVVMSVLVIGYMLSVSPSLTIYVIAPLPVLSICIYWVNNKIERKSTAIQESLSQLSSFVQEAFSGIRVIKSFVMEDKSLEDFNKESSLYRTRSLDLTKTNSLFNPLIMALVGISNLLVIYVGGLEVIAGKITPGNIAEFILYVNMLTWPFTSLGWVSSIVLRAEASQKRINEFLKIKTNIVSNSNYQSEIKGSIKVENVSFEYPETGVKALQNISFHVEAGKSLAILGTTSSGKSTIANMISRLIDPVSGKISIDDVDLKDWSINDYRSQIGYVPQDVFLFSDTIKQNILFGTKNPHPTLLEKVIDIADLKETIAGFELKLETILGERGITLSGGQKQRVSIARALIKDPKILILDDCLSAVDTKTENHILTRLEKFMKNRTSIIISHRISSAKLADYIIFLDEGKVVEEGTHISLYEKQGKYRELYDKQMDVSN